ncbi:MAG: thioredoxin domain-containing protein [Salinigranum sp.]
MSDDPTARNRLDEEESPYLRQHADNPVHWQPWDDAALAAARERDVPIFLSIGYSACHWCHVMEEESFQDPEVASTLNREFVPIKVDREERPDLDSVYMTICQLVRGQGGWPLSVWLTPEGKPFYVGTYFPRESRRGSPGFLELLGQIADSWRTDREEVENRAEQWTDALTDQLEETPSQPAAEPDAEAFERAVEAALRTADREFGGFGSGGPKFPQPSRIHLLLSAHARTGNRDALGVATKTLDAMADGGMYDHLGGGFHRYATDREWTVPHFEKMLYDNAELPRAYLAASRATGRDRYAAVARETFAFVRRELTHPEGGFYSTLDARSVPPGSAADSGEGAHGNAEEGAFYVWTPSGVRDVLGETLAADLFCDRYGVTPTGNFEGKTVLAVSESVEDLAEEYDLSAEEVERRLSEARESLFEAREGRPRPNRDEKVLAGWNGLMISAFADGARTLDPDLARPAEAALSFAREHLWNADERRLLRRYKDGDVKVEGYLEDYAFLARGAFDLYEASGDVDHLAFALDLARAIEAEFWDAEAETLYFTPESGERLVTRPQELHDVSTPSSLGVAVLLLQDLDAFVPHGRFADVAERVLATHASNVKGSPLEHLSLALASDRWARGRLELTVAADDLPESWREALAGRYLPGSILSVRPPTDEGLAEWLDRLGLDEAPPIWAGREARDGEPTVYACESFTCSPPQHDVEDALAWFEEEEAGE